MKPPKFVLREISRIKRLRQQRRDSLVPQFLEFQDPALSRGVRGSPGERVWGTARATSEVHSPDSAALPITEA